MNTIGLFAIIIWTAIFLTFLFIYLKSKDNKTLKGYVLASRELNRWQIALSLIASYIGGGTLIAFSGQVSKLGYAFIFLPIGVFIAFITYGIVSKYYRKRKEETEPSSITVVDRLVDTYGKEMFWPLIIILLITLLSFIAIQIYGGALLLSEILSIHKILAAILLTFITALYSRIGGSRGDVYTDIFQGIIIFFVIVGSLFFVYNICDASPHATLVQSFGTDNPELLDFFSQGWLFIVAMILLPIFAIHTDPSLHLRLYMAKSDKEARWGGIIAGFVYFIFSLALIYLVLGIVANGIGTGDKVLIDYALNHSNIFILVGFTIAIYSAVISTMDSQAIKTSSILVHNLFGRYNPKLQSNEDSQAKLIKAILPWVFLLGFSFAVGLFFVESAFLFLSSIWVIIIASFGLIFVGLWWPWLSDRINQSKRSRKIVKADMIISALIVIFAIVYFLIQSDKDPSSNILMLGAVLIILKLVVVVIIFIVYHVRKFIRPNK